MILQKTGCLIQSQKNPDGDLSLIVKEYLRLGFDFQITHMPLLQDYFHEIFREKLATMDLLRDDHLVMFFPLQHVTDDYLERVNAAYVASGESELSKVSLKWLPIGEILESPHVHVMHKEVLDSYRPQLVRSKKVKDEIDYVLFIIDDRKVKKMLCESLFHGNFYHPKHRWEYYEAFNSQFPSRKDLSTVKGIIFPGAYFSAYQDLPWIHKLKDFIRMVHADFPLIKMAGICFGHQILSQALGGQVCRMQDYLISISMPLYIGKEHIKI